jgi:hypothetical protein
MSEKALFHKAFSQYSSPTQDFLLTSTPPPSVTFSQEHPTINCDVFLGLGAGNSPLFSQKSSHDEMP